MRKIMWKDNIIKMGQFIGTIIQIIMENINTLIKIEGTMILTKQWILEGH